MGADPRPHSAPTAWNLPRKSRAWVLQNTAPMLRLSFALAVLATGCVGTLEPFDPGGGGGGPDGGGGGGVARQMFDDEVAPMIGICAGCHTGPADAVGDTSPNFMGTGGVANYYSAIIAEPAVTGNFVPANSTLLNKGAHEGVLAWDTTQSQTITDWLLAEAAER